MLLIYVLRSLRTNYRPTPAERAVKTQIAPWSSISLANKPAIAARARKAKAMGKHPGRNEVFLAIWYNMECWKIFLSCH